MIDVLCLSTSVNPVYVIKHANNDEILRYLYTAIALFTKIHYDFYTLSLCTK